MRRLFALILGLLCCASLFVSSPVSAQEDFNPFLSLAGNEKIELFEVDLTLEKNTDIRIKEKIHYYFPLPKHGIYRTIPVNKRTSGNALKTPTMVKINSVRYYHSNTPTEIQKEYSTDMEYGSQMSIKIGDEDELIQGLYTYEIDYIIKNGINYFEDHDELYWNIIGTGWNVPIEKVQATINLPGKIEKTACYTGMYQAKESNCILTNQSDTVLSLSNKGPIDANQAITIAVSMPKGSIEDVREKENARIKKNNILGLGSLILVPLFSLFTFKKSKLRSPKLTVVPNFTPPKDINLLVAGHLLSKITINPKTITAEIIDLAVKGHLEVEQKEKREYILRKLESRKVFNLPSSEKFYDSLFSSSNEINTKDKSQSAITDFLPIWEQIKTDAKEFNYLDESKEKRGILTIVFSIFFLFLGIGGVIGLSLFGSTLGGIALLITGLSIFTMSFFTDSRTEEGNRAYYELQGLKMYINTAEKRRIEFHNDPKKYSGVFEKLLPYAILFGLEKKWIKEFEDIYTTTPDWYKGDISTFNTYYLMNSVSSINSGISTPTGGAFSGGSSGFGGGGFSGGGGGGGGGGSW